MDSDVHTWAAQATRETLRRAVARAASEWERAGRANLEVPTLVLDGKAQLADARALLKRARNAGLV